MGNKSTDGFILDFGRKLPWKQQMTVAFQRLKWKAGLRESDRRAAESSQERQSILCWDQAVRGQLQTDHKCHLVVYWPKWPTETPQVKTVDFICWTGGNDSRIWLQRHLNLFFLFLSYPKRAKLCSSSWKKNFSTRSKENKRKKGQKVNFTFFFSHFLQAEVNYSGTQAEANQCDRSLALRKKERKKCHQMVFSLERETGLGIPESLRHRAPACASPLKYWSDLVGFKEIRSPQSYPQFNMEKSYISKYFVCFDLQKINWKKFHDQQLQQSRCFKQNQNRCCHWFEISKWKPSSRNKIFLEMFQ